MKLNLENPSTLFLVMLISMDTAFILFHLVVYHYDLPGIGPSNRPYLLWGEKSLPGTFNYIKEFWIALLCFLLALKNRSFLYFGWALFFLNLMIDDCFQGHEKIGAVFTKVLSFQPMFGLRAQDFGELFYWALFFGFYFLLIGSLYHFCKKPKVRLVSQYMLLLVFALSFFGVFIDMINIVIPLKLLVTIEEAGEMIVISIMAWFVFRLLNSGELKELSLTNLQKSRGKPQELDSY